MAKSKKEQQKKCKCLKQYLFRPDRVEAKEKEGWKKVKELKSSKNIVDLVLMQKNV